MARFLFWLVGLPVGIVMVALAVANRKPVTISFDPFNAAAPAFAIDLPLYVVIFAVLMAGVFLGGIAAWLNQGRHRRGERRWREEADRLRWQREQEIERERQARRATLAALPSPNGRQAA